MQHELADDPSLAHLRDAHISGDFRYFYTDKYGCVDIRHLAASALLAQQTTPFVAKALGFINECKQWLFEWGDAYRSGFSPEDIPSNSAGADFYSRYLRGDGVDVAQAFANWCKDVGARSAHDPASGRSNLPLTDPSEHGGAGGASNMSSKPPNTIEPLPSQTFFPFGI